jgi:hypothetical protein
VLVRCFAGCEFGDIVAALGLKPRDLFPSPNGHARQASRTTTYEVRDQSGALVARHVRIDLAGGGKRVYWEQPSGTMGLGGIPVASLPLYGIDALGDASEAIVTEGEKAAAALTSLGIAAVGTVTGAAGLPGDASLTPLLGVATVVLWPDADDAGRKHMVRIADRLLALGHAHVRVIVWPEAPPRGDAADFVAGGGSADGLRRLIEDAPVFGQGTGDAEPSPDACPWPTLDPAALHGLAGDIVNALAPGTEADPVALLLTTLVMSGNAVGRTPHVAIGEDRHGCNLFACFVGETSKARKGTSQAGPRRILAHADKPWASERVLGGLSSGEGLIWAIRDPIVRRNKKGEDELVDEGVADHRLLAIEEEFSAVLKAAQRQGNTISEQLRRAWDSRDVIATMTKANPARSTYPRVSLIAHVTRDELVRTLTDTDTANGFGNRLLWAVVRRSQALPFPQRLPDQDVAALGERMRRALDFGRKHAAPFGFETDASRIWQALYADLSEGQTGMYGALTARAEAQVLRLALVYAILDLATVITANHLIAALAVWDFCAASARYVFGDATGDPIADRILTALRSGGPMTQSQVNDLFGRNVGASRLLQALELLQKAGKITGTAQKQTGGDGRPAGGRPVTSWSAR